jgi:hypothetical protein
MKSSVALFISAGMLLSLSGCGTAPKKAVELAARSSTDDPFIELNDMGHVVKLEAPFPGVDWVQYKVLGARDAKEGRLIVESRREFLKEQLKQSYDPYYGTPRFSPECLSMNEVGEIQTPQGQTEFSARVSVPLNKFLVTQSWIPGYCGPAIRQGYLNTRFCADRSSVFEVLAAGPAAKDLILECEDAARIKMKSR